ncbi:MAG TPA: glycerol-3-phosphate dehydrogenase/oxidase [Mycobacteriales bacterium]|nr:glycerol-3-phosphate dehydrogenase/oxidase [Mycobacteriales bacterium]
MRPFSVLHRADDVADATAGEVDVLIVGLGATGAGVALDAAARGMSVVAVDKGDLSSGTSSKSSKLIHGGLRYLENYEFTLVHEGVTERQLLMKLAPHLVRPMDFVYPVWPDTAKRRLLGLGMTTYDVFAMASLGSMRSDIRRHDRLSAEEAIAAAPALERSGMEYAFVYGDCATDDSRLVLAVVREARRFGAVTLPYTEVTDFFTDANGAVKGAALRDNITGSTYEVRARHVVNATGVWVDTVMAMAAGSDGDKASLPSVQPSKGVHVVVPHARLPLTNTSVLLPSKQGDGRSMFAIPWGRQTILGTTDTAYDGPLDTIGVEQDDLDYVLASGNAVFDMGLEESDVVGAWAGARPLLRGKGDSMSDMSRRHTLIEGAGGLVTITGGKLTTYRRMAADVVDLLCARDESKARCRTDEIPLGSSRPLAALTTDVIEAAAAVSVDAECARLLVRQHGERAPDVLGLVAGDRSLRDRISPAAAHILAEVVYAAREEGAATLDDVLSRRMRISLRARDAGLPIAPHAARLLAQEIGCDDGWAEQQVRRYVDAVRRERGVLADTLDPVPATP